MHKRRNPLALQWTPRASVKLHDGSGASALAASQAATASSGCGRLRFRHARRGVVALEFAILSTVFMSLLLFVFEISYDQYCQEALDFGLNEAAREIGTGNAQNVQSVGQFTTTYLCPNLQGLLDCSTNVFVRIQSITFTGSADFYKATTGLVPSNGSALNLSSYGTGNFCNASPNQFYLLSAVYVGPSFVGILLKGLFTLTYGGRIIHATASNVAFASEYFSVTGASGTTPPLPQCSPTTVS